MFAAIDRTEYSFIYDFFQSKNIKILSKKIVGDGKGRHTHSLTHSLTYLLTYSLTYSLTHLLTHLLTYSLTLFKVVAMK